MILPSGGLAGTAETVTDPDERRLALRQVLRAAGFAAAFESLNPYTDSDEEMDRKVGRLPLVRIRPSGLAAGPSDLGGWAWITVFVLSAALFLLRRGKK